MPRSDSLTAGLMDYGSDGLRRSVGHSSYAYHPISRLLARSLLFRDGIAKDRNTFIPHNNGFYYTLAGYNSLYER